MNNDKVIEHFEKRALIYNSTSWVNNQSMLQSIADCINCEGLSKYKLLDLGAGTGVVSNYIWENCFGNKEIVAVDICEAMLKQLNNPKIEKCVASIDQLPYADETFDIVVSRQCLHYVEQLDIVVKEIRRVLKTNGLFILCQIVPIESETKYFWRKMMTIRQPLRRVFFSAEEWIKYLTNRGFLLKLTKKLDLRYSMNMWAKLYNANDNMNLEEYINIFEQAPEQYFKEYQVEINGNKVWITGKAVTMSLVVDK